MKQYFTKHTSLSILLLLLLACHPFLMAQSLAYVQQKTITIKLFLYFL